MGLYDSRHPPLSGCLYNARMNSPLDAVRIADLSRAAAAGLEMEVVASTGSTNADLRARLHELHQPYLLAAENQTAGRGRAGRSWLAAAGDSLCFSLAWRFTGPIARLSGLSLAVGVALAEVLRARGSDVKLKWPNDLLLNEAKLGGILIETMSSRSDTAVPAGAVWAVIGVGINVHANAERDAGIGHAVAALNQQASDRNALLAMMADGLAAALTQFDAEGLAPFIQRWQEWHAHAGQAVQILDAGTVQHQGVAIGIDDDGCLLLDTAQGQLRIAAGDVSLRSTSFKETAHAVTD